MPRNFISRLFFCPIDENDRRRNGGWRRAVIKKTPMENLGGQLNRNGHCTTAANTDDSFATSSEVISDGTVTKLIGGVPGGDAQLMLWVSANEIPGSVVKRVGCVGNVGCFCEFGRCSGRRSARWRARGMQT